MNPWAIIPLVSCVAYAALLLAVLLQSRTWVKKMFALFILVSGAWAFSAFMLTSGFFTSSQSLVFWNDMVVLIALGSMVVYYHFVRAYTDKRAGFLSYLGYAFVLAVLLLSLGGYAVQDAQIVNGYLYHDMGFMPAILFAAWIPFTFVTLRLLVQRYRQSLDSNERNRTMYLLLGWGIISIYSPLNASIPLFALLPTDHFGTLINALIITYAISKYELLDIRLVARKGLSYFILISSLLGLYAALIFVEIRIFPDLPLLLVVFSAAILALFLVIMSRPLRFYIEDKVGHLFHGETYIYRQAAHNFGNKMGHVLNMDEVAKEMLSVISGALHLTQSRLLFAESDGSDFIVNYVYPSAEGGIQDNLRFSSDSPIVSWLAGNNQPIDVTRLGTIPQLKGLWQEEKIGLSSSGAKLLYPIMSREKLLGIMALSEKYTGTPYTTEDMSLITAISNQASIIIENAKLYTHAKERANFDELTGLCNHRFFHQRVDEEIARCSRFGEVFSLLLMDIDLFKSYNDTYGHLYGDKILKEVGERIKKSVRTVDIAFRYGGDEFSFMLPQTQFDTAVNVAERIRKDVEYGIETRGAPLSCSIGLASWPTDGVMREELIQAADKALYQAKQSGRNKVCLASQMTPSQDRIENSPWDHSNPILNTIYALSAAVDTKDTYTYGHSKKVSKYATEIAEVMGLSQEKIATIRTAGLLHDIGKIGVSDYILCKRDTLTDEEWQPIRAHPTMGVSILRHVGQLKDCLPAVQHHHERYDGTGYPGGLKGDNIPIDARIITVADSFDAITSSRPYREGKMTYSNAIDELERCSGQQFDPAVVKVFIHIIRPKMALHPSIVQELDSLLE
ncbi:diguanylate cyclase [Chloroflexota bacterium]